MSEFREDDQAGNDAMQAFWRSPLGRLWKQKDKEAIKELQDEEKARAMGILLPISKVRLERFKTDKLEVIKIMDEMTKEEMQASKSLGVAVHDLKNVGGAHFTSEEIGEIEDINNQLIELEERFDKLLMNKYDE